MLLLNGKKVEDFPGSDSDSLYRVMAGVFLNDETKVKESLYKYKNL